MPDPITIGALVAVGVGGAAAGGAFSGAPKPQEQQVEDLDRLRNERNTATRSGRSGTSLTGGSLSQVSNPTGTALLGGGTGS